MSGKICCFSGHRLVLNGNVKERVETKIEELVCEGFTEFYSGGMGVGLAPAAAHADDGIGI